MDKEQVKKLLVEMKSTQFGVALLTYLQEELSKLDSVSKISEDADFEINARANKKAVKVIKELFSLMNIEEFAKNKNHPYT